MKVSKRDISIVMVLLGVIALFCVYQFYYRSSQKKVQDLQDSIDASTVELEELRKINESALRNQMTESEENLVRMIKEYPAYYRLDDLVMYLYDLEQKEDEYGVHFYEYTMGASEELESYTGQIKEKQVEFLCNKAVINAQFTTDSYEGCKKMLRAVYNDPEAKNFSSIRLTYDNVHGMVYGEISMNFYGVTDRAKLEALGGTNNYPKPEVLVPEVTKGVDCVFGPTVSPTPELELEGEDEENQQTTD